MGIEVCTVHDSYAVLPSQVAQLRDTLLAELRRLYETSDLLTQVRENAARALGSDKGLPRVSTVGELRIEQVTGPYAFA